MWAGGRWRSGHHVQAFRATEQPMPRRVAPLNPVQTNAANSDNLGGAFKLGQMAWGEKIRIVP
jgi:hypothetical protein